MSLPLNKDTFIIFHSELVWDYFIIIHNNTVLLEVVARTVMQRDEM